MRSQRISQAFTITTAAAAAALLLTACGGGDPQAEPTTSASNSGSATSAPASASASPTPSAPATTAPATSAPATTPAATALCKASGLVAETDPSGGGAAGSVYMKLNLTNTGTEPCLLKGYAGVSLTADAAGDPIGAAAARDVTTPETEVLLAPGETGTAVLRYVQAGNFPDCAQVRAGGYRVYPPEDTASLFLPDPTNACSNAGINLLSIGAFQPS
ncbi:MULTISPECIES: DUF4232 domain-containing protein [Micrococcaceae]|uniref:DUF4232 domain-containing protein n=1 Tax=Micrococcaceae TaxID=1268 RepID=UPI0009E50D06|nr:MULTISPECIES: DUF4232 domain-containing protein [Micrococcaceae]